MTPRAERIEDAARAVLRVWRRYVGDHAAGPFAELAAALALPDLPAASLQLRSMDGGTVDVPGTIEPMRWPAACAPTRLLQAAEHVAAIVGEPVGLSPVQGLTARHARLLDALESLRIAAAAERARHAPQHEGGT